MMFFGTTTASHREARVPRGTRVYAVGDIHGRDDLLSELLDRIEQDAWSRPIRATVLVFLGDYIDRGPASRGVVERLRTLRLPDTQTIFLAGNHEEALVRILRGSARHVDDWLRFGGRECLASYGLDPDKTAAMTAREAARAIREAIPAEHAAFLTHLGDSLSIGGYLFVHAGIRPGVPLARQSQDDLRWIRRPFLDDDRDHGFIVVHGHTISDGVDQTVNRIGIDTGAYRTGILTALVLEGAERRYIQTGDKNSPVPPSDDRA